MKIGDKVRDKTRGIIGTVIAMEPRIGAPQRLLVQQDAAPGGKTQAVAVKVWATVQQIELIDLSGKAVQGTRGRDLPPGQPVQATGARVNDQGTVQSGPMSGTGTNYDSAGNRIEMH